MKILVIGSGGREHVLAWKLSQSPQVSKVFVAPGNGGMKADFTCVNIAADNLDELLKFAMENKINLTVVGPEVPLVMGITDLFQANGLKVFGPNKACALFEGSKAFTKEFLLRHKIPTAGYKEYVDRQELLKDVGIYGYPMVIKADGLAAGKGVIIAEDKKIAVQAINSIMQDREFGEAGDKVVVEEFLTGTEASILCFVDGKTIVPMESAQDYKRAYDGDKGLNTGGMGTYSPNVLFDDIDLKNRIQSEILTPIIEGFKADKLNFKGILFVGLMIDAGIPKVLEFNVRFGDPEAQSVLPRLKTDLVDIMLACIDGKLDGLELEWAKDVAVTVVMASGGYPGSYPKGIEIFGLDKVKNCHIFHAGTASKDGKILTDGGRVLCLSTTAPNFMEARNRVYSEIEKIKFDGGFYRKDIAKITVEN